MCIVVEERPSLFSRRVFRGRRGLNVFPRRGGVIVEKRSSLIDRRVFRRHGRREVFSAVVLSVAARGLTARG